MKANQKERQITLKHILINNERMIGIKFYPDKVVQALIKELPKPRWSEQYGMVVLPNNKVNLNEIFKKFKGVAWVNTKYFFVNRPVNEGNQILSVDDYRKRPPKPNWKYCPEEFYQKLEIRRYSMNTARVYIPMFERFINFFPAASNPMELSELDVKKYLQSLVQQNKSDSYINQSINAIKFYYEVVKEMPNRFYDIERPIRKEKLPEVISKGDVQAMIKYSKNLKHKCIISLLYSTGMRRGELLHLKITDIDSKRMSIFIRNGKGGKDRYVLLGEKMLKDLRTYYLEFEPDIWLFEGSKGKKYSGSSVENVV